MDYRERRSLSAEIVHHHYVAAALVLLAVKHIAAVRRHSQTGRIHIRPSLTRGNFGGPSCRKTEELNERMPRRGSGCKINAPGDYPPKPPQTSSVLRVSCLFCA